MAEFGGEGEREKTRLEKFFEVCRAKCAREFFWEIKGHSV